MSIFKRKQQFQGQKKSPLLKFALAALAAVFVGAGAIALATIGGATLGTAAIIGLGALGGGVLFGAAGAAFGVIPGFAYARAVEKSKGDGWHSTAAIMTGVAACAVLGFGYGAYNGYTRTARYLTDHKGDAKTSFNIQASPQKAAVPAKTFVLSPSLF